MTRSLFRSARVLAVFAAVNVVAFAGCQTFSSGNADAEGVLSPARNPTIGYVVWVDHAEKTAVVHLARGVSPSIYPMIARNDAMVETARLEATDTRQGQTMGVRVVNGFPNTGDEVVLLRETE